MNYEYDPSLLRRVDAEKLIESQAWQSRGIAPHIHQDLPDPTAPLAEADEHLLDDAALLTLVAWFSVALIFLTGFCSGVIFARFFF